jgi:serine protease Do
MRRKGVVIGVLAATAVAGAALLAPVVMGQGPDRARGGPRPAFQFPFEGGSRIGASVRDVQDEDVSREKLASPNGAVIERLDTDGPAGRAGLKVGDVVVDFDGERVRSALHLTRLVRETPEGRAVKVGIVRGAARTVIEVTPAGSRAMGPDERIWRESVEELEELGRRFDVESLVGLGGSRGRLGVEVQPLTPQLAEFFGVKQGLLVASVVESSPAATVGIKAGDIILSVGGQPVASRGQLVRALRDQGDAAQTSIEYSRQGKTATATVALAAREGRPRTARARPRRL